MSSDPYQVPKSARPVWERIRAIRRPKKPPQLLPSYGGRTCLGWPSSNKACVTPLEMLFISGFGHLFCGHIISYSIWWDSLTDPEKAVEAQWGGLEK